MTDHPGSTEKNPWTVLRVGTRGTVHYRNDFSNEAEARNFAARMHRNNYTVTIIEPDGYMMTLR